MKIKIGFIVLILCVCASDSWGAWPGECSFVYCSGAVDVPSYGTMYSSNISATGFMSSSWEGYHTNPGLSCVMYSKYYENDAWYTQGSGMNRTFFVPHINHEYLRELPADCEGLCAAEKARKEEECGGAAMTNWDSVECTGTCKLPCEAEIDESTAACGDQEFVTWIDATEPECSWYCNNCEDAFQDALEFCGNGMASMNQETCEYECNDCSEYNEAAEEQCKNSGGVYSASCKVTNTYDENERGYYTTVPTCIDDAPETDYVTPPNNPPSDQETPTDQTPENDPTIDPADTPDQESNKWLQAIKDNQGKMLNNSNVTNQYLNNINQNLKTNTDNQHAMNQNIITLGQIGERGNQKLDGIKAAIENIDVGGDAPDESYNGTAPDTPDFDGSLPTENDYTEYDNADTLASTAAQEQIDLIDADIAANPSPIDAQITATGDACLDGTVTINGHNKALSICFNRPWMLQGYAIMKVILIGIGYLQTAMLLNRAIVS